MNTNRMQKEIIIRDIIVVFMIIVGIILGIKHFSGIKFSKSDNNYKHSFIDLNNIEFRSCSDADNNIRIIVDNLSEVFSGAIYYKPIVLCVLDENTAYCKKSDIISTGNISVIFFSKSCFEGLLPDFDGDKVIIPLTYAEVIKNETDVYKLYKEGYIYVDSSKIIDGLISPEKVINNTLLQNKV